jgi:ComF family protein
VSALAGPRCTVCAEGLPTIFAQHHAGEYGLGQEAICEICRLDPPLFERTIACGGYDGALRDLIHLLKFYQVRPAAAVLGRMLAQQIRTAEPSMPQGTIAVVPVPLHRSKQSQRGFNQAEQIARLALKELRRPERFELQSHALLRTRDTGSQIGLSRDQRREHLRGAFAVKNPAAISGRNILLVDDVYTTGATASECARALRKAKAASVWVAVIARTQRVSDLAAGSPDFAQEDSLHGKLPQEEISGEVASRSNAAQG